MQAIILAAGMGKRLKNLTRNNTKCMVKVNGVALIDRMLHQLDRLSLDRIVIVVGYESEKLIEYISGLDINTSIEYIENKVYDKTNNIYSLSLAEDYLIQDDTLLLESDLIFEDDVLVSLLEDKRETLALVDKYQSWMDGTVMKIDSDDNILDFVSSKKFTFADRDDYYKTVNIYKFSRHFSETHYLPFLNAYKAVMGNNEYYEQVLRVITLLDDPEIKAKRLDGRLWYEIDDIQDLSIAETIFATDEEERLARLLGSYGGYWRYPKLLDFCYLVNPFYPPKKLIDEMKASFEGLLCQYPSGADVNTILASRNYGNVKPAYMLVGNGAAELIKAIMEQIHGIVGVINPTFEEYPNRYNQERIVSFTPDNRGFRYDETDVIQYFSEHPVDVMILINPDNPTGNYIKRDGIIKIFTWSKETNKRVVIDESFIDFADEETVTFLDDAILEAYPNVIVVKSISKSYGVPGIRLGVAATGDLELVSAIRKKVAIWNINSFGEFYMQIAEKYKNDYEISIQKLTKERQRFLKKLAEIQHLEIFPTQANYCLARLTGGMTAHELTKRLLAEYDILIKDLSPKIRRVSHVEGEYIRIAVRNQEDNDCLLKALNKILAGHVLERERRSKMGANSKWQKIWNAKQVVSQDNQKNEFDRFCELKKANGFDVAVENPEAYYRGFYNEWVKFYDKMLELAGEDIESVFEVGCGSGVNLYMFLKRLNCRVGGVDYSESMIASARITTGAEDLVCCGADDISIEPKYDVVMSESVFQYFDSLEYAESVLRKMIEKSKKITYLGEIQDAEYEQELMDLRRRTIENYDERYEGLDKRFYKKSWIEKIAAEYGRTVVYTTVDNPEYINGKYIFNCYIIG